MWQCQEDGFREILKLRCEIPDLFCSLFNSPFVQLLLVSEVDV